MSNRFIEKLNNFASLTPEDADVLRTATARVRQFGARHDLIREGDRPGPVFVILDGWACRYKILPSGTRQILAFLMPGDCCDLHVGLLAEMDHGIQTITAATVATIDRVEMNSIMEHNPSIANALYISQLIDEGTMRAWITSMGRRSSTERVAHLLCELYIRARNVSVTSQLIMAFPMSQILLADALGMTPVHMNRVLKDIRKSGAVEVERRQLTVVDPGHLAQIAGFDENYLHRRLRKPD